MKKWTVAFVNYKTSIYLKWQLKILYQLNNPEDFEVIIVDNSSPYEKEVLNSITLTYLNQWNNIKILYNVVQEKIASYQHAEGLTLAVNTANTEYFLAQDPDFFFVRHDYLSFLEKFLQEGKIAVGAPYTLGAGFGHPKFPALFGTAMPLKIIKGRDLMPYITDETKKDSDERFKGRDFSYDVGYKLRKELSSPDRDDNFVAFDCNCFQDLDIEIGLHSFEMVSQAYSYQGEKIAYHLFGGAFTSKPVGDADLNKSLAPNIMLVRNKIGEWFYNYATSPGNKSTSLPLTIRKFFRKWFFRMGKFDNVRKIVLFNLFRITHKSKKAKDLKK
ncbi:MAG: hypothetical protein J6Y94_05470 [Bacteriovoracaceae bacterium]|nr:hypothetical protein [Bacteriovoracaceae bacterium]